MVTYNGLLLLLENAWPIVLYCVSALNNMKCPRRAKIMADKINNNIIYLAPQLKLTSACVIKREIMSCHAVLSARAAQQNHRSTKRNGMAFLHHAYTKRPILRHFIGMAIICSKRERRVKCASRQLHHGASSKLSETCVSRSQANQQWPGIDELARKSRKAAVFDPADIFIGNLPCAPRSFLHRRLS